ncbi:hypothetical protein [Rheinheimera baltica]|uniref:hypothetical protein n=1 Tax=Rheinheimera baltica TaxID=67576 RepID=UPI00273D737B|nr:hypothetical protein [Rheinheimera baltica]MDP5151720.1 hypothetical protein [Rheinheimera baltica]MDP5190862.1 hypothetical protein [Rheinheimera baltica]
MTSEQTEESHSFMHYAALKTAIVNGEEQLLKELLANQSMQPLEKDCLLDLARLDNNPAILALLEAVPVTA